MKTIVQKIHVEEQYSFACRTYRTPDFETNWHMHEECELIVITAGHGTVMIGEYVGEYKTGDVYFIASNLPHWFRKQHHRANGSATVVHFKSGIFGETFLKMPELKNIQSFIKKQHGLRLERILKKQIAAAIADIEKAKGFHRLQLLLQCLQKISTSNSHNSISHDFISVNLNLNPAIEKVIDFSFKNYLTQVTLLQVASIANMSIPTFCRFFKKNIKKTYFDFLQELKISHACKLLTGSNRAVMSICYESGYNSWAHFSKQFKKIKKMTPTQYRSQFEKSV